MIWLVILIAAAGTLALRLAFLIGGRFLTLPPWSRRVTDLVFPVAIAGLLGAGLRTTAAGSATDIVALAAGAVVTVLVGRRTRFILAAMGAGLATVLAVTAAAAMIM